MSGDYDNELRGSLFKNDRKESDRHPDYKGSAQIEGQDYWVSAWVKTSKAGKKYMSLSFQEKVSEEQQRSVTVSDDDDDDLPF